MTEFGKLSPDGKYEALGNIPQKKMLECPFAIMAFEHYNKDGSCKCYDSKHREYMKENWEYTDDDFREVGLI